MITVRVTCNSGNSWTTCINATIDEAREYFIGRSFVTHDDEETGEETRDTVINVALV